jgi:putative acyl-CoA dehydrogenase
MAELEESSGIDDRLDRAVTSAKTAIADATDLEWEARRIVERLATTWAGTLLARHGDTAAFDAYATTRLGGDHGSLFGTLPVTAPVDDLVARAVPA